VSGCSAPEFFFAAKSETPRRKSVCVFKFFSLDKYRQRCIINMLATTVFYFRDKIPDSGEKW
jgi:hypothetical protein